MKSKQKFHLIMEAFRYLPVFVFVLMMAHVGLLLLGYDWPVSEIAVTLTLFWIAWHFSKILDYCMMHRLCINYSLAVFVCIWLRKYTDGDNGLFGEHINIARAIVVILGLALMMLLICKRRTKK